ncbi:G protein-coupled receptor rhodopsin-like, partial [Trinorchestia longiramus]
AHCGISRNLKRRRTRNKHSRAVKCSKIRQDDETAHSNNISVTFVENTAEQMSSGNLNTMGFLKPFHPKPPTEGDPRLQKVNQLLCSITVVFCVSWLPLNVFNCISDTFFPTNEMTEKIIVLYTVCHLCGMSSACSNPFLYGWLNNNFRNEFSSMFACRFRRHCSCLRALRQSQQPQVMKEPRSKLSFKSTRVSSAVPLSSFAKVSDAHGNGAPLETSLND